jgi:L-aspartate oxidase
MLTKRSVMDSNTRYAQGGIAAVTAEDDSPKFHRQDTMIAGAGLCDAEAVEVLVTEGPACVADLVRYGTKFDTGEDGAYELTKEGAHSHRRILHAQGDATGAEIVRALHEQAKDCERVTVWDDHFVIDLLTAEGECWGVLAQKPDGSLFIIEADATILASGGAGQLYRYTTNPDVATGDGIAIAFRAGAEVRDLEFMQFHPTTLNYPGAPRFLISEAVRGEGAVLRNIRGERFMEGIHPQLELAPRDVVARAIVSEMEKTKSTFVYLDITHESEALIRHRFPTIYEFCLRYGLDMTTDWIPVSPAAHYMMGGVKTDLNGETSIHRLFACGEVSSSGVHGANRLASNSLSEAIVFGRRIVQRIATLEPAHTGADTQEQSHGSEPLGKTVVERRLKLQKIMLRYAGIERSAQGLDKGLDELARQLPALQQQLNRVEDFEFANLLTLALLTTRAALMREESRGGHYRTDFVERDDLLWKKHIVFALDHTSGTSVWKERIDHA